jgi:hypothetical protein
MIGADRSPFASKPAHISRHLPPISPVSGVVPDNVSTETKKRKIMKIVIFGANGATGKILMKQAPGKIETS